MIEGDADADDVICTIALVVDDNLENRGLCILALEYNGYQVVEAENGQQALDILNDRSFQLLILDLAMPKVDGLSVIRELGKSPRHEPMCVIVMTANPHMYLQGEDNPVVDYVMYKPIDIVDFSSLLFRLRDLLSGQSLGQR